MLLLLHSRSLLVSVHVSHLLLLLSVAPVLPLLPLIGANILLISPHICGILLLSLRHISRLLPLCVLRLIQIICSMSLGKCLVLSGIILLILRICPTVLIHIQLIVLLPLHLILRLLLLLLLGFHRQLGLSAAHLPSAFLLLIALYSRCIHAILRCVSR